MWAGFLLQPNFTPASPDMALDGLRDAAMPADTVDGSSACPGERRAGVPEGCPGWRPRATLQAPPGAVQTSLDKDLINQSRVSPARNLEVRPFFGSVLTALGHGDCAPGQHVLALKRHLSHAQAVGGFTCCQAAALFSAVALCLLASSISGATSA
jgi:hypothetical protein